MLFYRALLSLNYYNSFLCQIPLRTWLLGKVNIWSYRETYRKIPIDVRRIGRISRLHSFFFFILLFIFFICSEFCHTLKWNGHGFTCVPHPDTPSHLPLHPLPLGLPSALGPSACLMHPSWAGDLFHPW